MLDERVYRHEATPLKGLRDSFPKLVLTLDRYRSGITGTSVRVRDATPKCATHRRL